MNSRLWFLWRSLSVLIHIIGVGLYGFALVFQFAYPWGYNWKQNDQELKFANSTARPGEYSFGWKYKFLTYWNMNFQFFIFLLHLLCDCFKVNYLPTKAIESNFVKHLFRTRDTLFHSVLFPIGWFVSSMFWSLYFFKKEYVINATLEDRNPWWLTHIGHTIVAPLLLLEALTTYHRRSKLFIEMSILLIIISSYVTWVYYLGIFQEIWVYGILKKSSTTIRAVLLSSFAVYLVVLYFIGLLLHQFLWPKRRREVWPKKWSADEISKDQLEFEDFRVRQGLIR